MILSESMKELQTLKVVMKCEFVQMGLDVIIDQARFVVYYQTPTDNEHLTLSGQQIKKVENTIIREPSSTPN